MGAWGPGLYQNDTAEDVKSYFIDQLHRGKTAEQITQTLITNNQEALSDPQECMDFWCALADAQWDKGRLLPSVKERAITCLIQDDILLDWCDAPKNIVAKRKQVLEKLLQKLNTPQPPEKRISQYRLYQCPWKVGDVFSLPIETAAESAHGLNGKKLLIEMADTGTWHPGHSVPIVYLKLVEAETLPISVEAYNKLAYLKLWQEHLSEEQVEYLNGLKKKAGDLSALGNYLRSLDTQRVVTRYRIRLITTSSRMIPPNLQFLGNYSGIIHPKKEYIPEEKINIHSEFWKSLVDMVSDRLSSYNADYQIK